MIFDGFDLIFLNNIQCVKRGRIIRKSEGNTAIDNSAMTTIAMNNTGKLHRVFLLTGSSEEQDIIEPLIKKLGKSLRERSTIRF